MLLTFLLPREINRYWRNQNNKNLHLLSIYYIQTHAFSWWKHNTAALWKVFTIVHLNKLRFRKLSYFIQNHTIGKWWTSWAHVWLQTTVLNNNKKNKLSSQQQQEVDSFYVPIWWMRVLGIEKLSSLCESTLLIRGHIKIWIRLVGI